MKKFLIAALALSMFMACNNSAQKTKESQDSTISQNENTNSAGKGKIVFAETSYDFGTVKEGAVVDYTFKFKNEGTEPVILAQVTAGCGCTTPNYSTEPVLPGKEGEVSVSFNSAGHPGVQQKLVTVTSNAENGILTVELKGTVEKVN